jgi:hypothetical protein
MAERPNEAQIKRYLGVADVILNNIKHGIAWFFLYLI